MGIGDTLRSQLLGGSGLKKLTIQYQRHLRSNGVVEALFNPAEISRSRSVRWHEQRQAARGTRWIGEPAYEQFVSVDAESLSLTLFFDTYESRDAPSGVQQRVSTLVATANPFATSDASNVTELTDQIAQLAEIDRELHHPPVCRLSWGGFGTFFTGVLTQLDQQYTMFMPDGMPVRATLACTFTEFLTPGSVRRGEPRSSDVVKTRVVKRGDTLQSLAAQEYRDPALWREIARANRISNPRRLVPGTVLTIPKLAG